MLESVEKFIAKKKTLGKDSTELKGYFSHSLIFTYVNYTYFLLKSETEIHI